MFSFERYSIMAAAIGQGCFQVFLGFTVFYHQMCG
jgi:hypothetical protein